MRVAAPLRLDEETVRLAVIWRLAWIWRKRDGFLRQERQSRREFVSGESSYFEGGRNRILRFDRPPAIIKEFNELYGGIEWGNRD